MSSAAASLAERRSTSTARLADFRDRHRGEAIVVCGCGESLKLLDSPERFVTIGVNDVGRLFQPTYLVVVNPPAQFAAGRFRYVEQSGAQALFTQLDLPVSHPRVVRIALGTRGGTDFSDPNVLHYTSNSPYLAVCLAAHMGAKRIGLIGVDFTDHHFFGQTGRHPLAARLEQIDAEYGKLVRALRARDIELVNLSRQSRLTAIPKLPLQDFDSGPARRSEPAAGRRVFFVNYRFLSCGDVFARGLRSAASGLGVSFDEAWWDDPELSRKVEAFGPDLLFVVHGRRFVKRWGDVLKRFRSAVWLLDEPYEVDDTSSWSGLFDTVFVNDPGTLDRHRNAHYLPVCHDPALHFDAECERKHRVGFVGGPNRTREQFLSVLARDGMLSYVIGGPWRDPAISRLCLASNAPPEQVAELYRQTQVVVNVFRDIHHFNKSGTPGQTLNPRIYEALACGAAVVSEARPGLGEAFPEIPTFGNAQQLLAVVRELLSKPSRRADIVTRCRERLDRHTYTARLAEVLSVVPPKAVPGVPGKAAGDSGTEAPAVDSRLASGNAGAHPIGKTAPEPLQRNGSPIAKRNLLYHVWPVKGATWRWNVEQLLKRIDIFNGHRIISVVHDARSEAPEAVREMLVGHGCEFVVAPNDPRGQAAVFPALLEKVKSTAFNECTFYGHAKGVKYGAELPGPVRRWTLALYEVNLDDWLTVKKQLDRHPMTGAFKMRGHFACHQRLGDWHYSGTFFWFKNGEAFSRNYQRVPEFYHGVEVWPGLLFSAEETGCLFLDGLGEVAYLDRFWRRTGDAALARWKSQRSNVPPPGHLAKPLPYEGHEWPRLEQLPQEFDWWIRTLLEADVRSLLNLGAGQGGIEWHVARKFREHGRNIEIAAVDLSGRGELVQALDDARSRFGQEIRFFPGDSTSPSTKAALGPHYDAVFIDSDHSFRAVSSDFEFALSRSPRVIGLHDIVDSDWHAVSLCCVSRLWDALRLEYETQECSSADWGGIGVVWPERRRSR